MLTKPPPHFGLLYAPLLCLGNTITIIMAAATDITTSSPFQCSWVLMSLFIVSAFLPTYSHVNVHIIRLVNSYNNEYV